jgi:hypothetical protein
LPIFSSIATPTVYATRQPAITPPLADYFRHAIIDSWPADYAITPPPLPDIHFSLRHD